MSNMLARMLDSMKEWARSERCMDAPGLGRHQENRNRGAMNKIAWVSATVLLVYLTGCCSVPSTKPLEGVAVSKVIDQIKQDLTNSSAANMKVGDGKVKACGDDSGKPLVLMRASDPPTVTMKLSTAKVIDVTVGGGVSKLPVFGVLFSADASIESKRQETAEQDITFAIVRPTNKAGDLIPVAVPESQYSDLGKLINEAELGVLGANHELRPCLQLTKLSVNVLVDVTRTVAADGSIGFLLLYSVTAKGSHSNELKNQIQVDLAYDKNTLAAFDDK